MKIIVGKRKRQRGRERERERERERMRERKREREGRAAGKWWVPDAFSPFLSSESGTVFLSHMDTTICSKL